MLALAVHYFMHPLLLYKFYKAQKSKILAGQVQVGMSHSQCSHHDVRILLIPRISPSLFQWN